MKTIRSLFLLLATLYSLLTSVSADDFRLKNKPEQTDFSANFWIFCDGAVGVQKFDGRKLNIWTRSAKRIPYFNTAGVEEISANLQYDFENSTFSMFQTNGSFGGTGVNFVMGRASEAFRINASSGATNLSTIDGAALRLSPGAGQVLELTYNSGTGAKLAAVTGDVTISGAVSSGKLNTSDIAAINGATPSASTSLILPAGATGVSPIRIPHGSAPTSPVDGDVWTTTAGLFIRVNGVTFGPVGDATKSGSLAQFGSTTSSQLRGVLSDESGTDVFLTANGTGNGLTLGGANLLTGTINFSSADTITITSNAGVIDVTKPYGSATNGAATTLTFSTDNVAATRTIKRLLINSDGTNARAFTLSTVTPVTITVPASTTIPVVLKSQGASGWALDGGATNVLDLTADTTPALTKLVETVDATTGASGKSTIDNILAKNDARTKTLSNTRINIRTGSTTSSATPTINTDNVDFYSLTAQAADITSFTTNLSGTPVEGQKLWIAITGTAARAITWGTSFEASTVALPTTTVTTARLDVGFVWNTVTSKWRCVAAQ